MAGPVGNSPPAGTRDVAATAAGQEILVEAMAAEPEACSGCDVCDGVSRLKSPVASECLPTDLQAASRRTTL
jgi:hypothetical protein